jgi:hypothetical protein
MGESVWTRLFLFSPVNHGFAHIYCSSRSRDNLP